MGTPSKHTLNSISKWGGSIEDYEEIHNFLDSSKFHIWNWRHRAIYHHTEGIKLCEKLFGYTITNSDGVLVDVREIASKHIIEDCGIVPTIQDWLHDLKPKRFAVNFNHGE